MMLKRFMGAVVALVLLAGNELNAAITMTTPPNGLTAPALQQSASGACPANTTIQLTVKFKPIGGTLGPVGSKSMASSATGTYNIKISDMVYTGSGAYFYKASYGNQFGTFSVMNICAIP